MKNFIVLFSLSILSISSFAQSENTFSEFSKLKKSITIEKDYFSDLIDSDNFEGSFFSSSKIMNLVMSSTLAFFIFAKCSGV